MSVMDPTPGSGPRDSSGHAAGHAAGHGFANGPGDGRDAGNGPVRLTLVSDALYFGGAERYLVALAAHLDRRIFRVSALVPEENQALIDLLREAGVAVSTIERPGLDWRRGIRIGLRSFGQVPGDVAHLNLPSSYDGGISSWAWAAKHRGYRRVVTTEHLPMIDRKYKRFPVKFLFTHWVDAAISIAQCNRALLVDRHGIDADKVRAIPNGVEPPPRLSAEARDRLRREWGARPGDVVLGNVARLTARKGQSVLLQALAQLPETFRLVLVGEGEDEASLRGAAEQLGIARRVHFSGSRPDAASLPQAFDLFVLPSFIETMPLTVLEAMAGGTAVVASAVYGVPEIVSHGESGWLVPAGDVARLVEALRLLGEDQALRERLARAGQARYEAEFTAARMAERTSAVYLDRDRSGDSIGTTTRRARVGGLAA